MGRTERCMSGSPTGMKAAAWTRAQLDSIARQYFPGSGAALESAVRTLANRHEADWRATARGGFRPTASMYALALSWRLKEVGPTCAFCKERIVLPRSPSPPAPGQETLALVPGVPVERGGLNVPQNLLLGHRSCVPGA